MRVVFFVLVIGLLLAGCSSQQQAPTELVGKQGVVLSVNQAPDEVFEGEEFSITYQLENVGAQEVVRTDPGVFTFSYDSLYLEYVDRVDRFSSDAFWLRPRTLYTAGESSFVTAYFRARDIERFSESVSTSVLAAMCYPYNSTVTTQVCIETTRESDPGSIVCRNTPINPQTPAAPVGVDLITVRTARMGDEVVPQFRLQIKNLDSGVPATSRCNSVQSEAAKGLNEVFVSAQLIGEPLVCLGSGTDGAVRLTNGRGLVTCTLPEGSSLSFTDGQSNYLSLLTVDIAYTYRDSERSTLRVVR